MMRDTFMERPYTSPLVCYPDFGLLVAEGEGAEGESCGAHLASLHPLQRSGERHLGGERGQRLPRARPFLVEGRVGLHCQLVYGVESSLK